MLLTFLFHGLIFDSDLSHDPHTHPSHNPLSPTHSPSHNSPLKSPRRHTQNHHKTRHNQQPSHKSNQQYTASGSRKLAADNVVLGFKVAVEAYEEDQDADCDEGCTEGFAHMS